MCDRPQPFSEGGLGMKMSHTLSSYTTKGNGQSGRELVPRPKAGQCSLKPCVEMA